MKTADALVIFLVLLKMVLLWSLKESIYYNFYSIQKRW